MKQTVITSKMPFAAIRSCVSYEFDHFNRKEHHSLVGFWLIPFTRHWRDTPHIFVHAQTVDDRSYPDVITVIAVIIACWFCCCVDYPCAFGSFDWFFMFSPLQGDQAEPDVGIERFTMMKEMGAVVPHLVVEQLPYSTFHYYQSIFFLPWGAIFTTEGPGSMGLTTVFYQNI